MGNVLKLLVNGIVKYLESHPEEIEKLAEWLVKELLAVAASKTA